MEVEERSSLLFDVSILDESYRLEAENRSKAVTLALEKYIKDHPRNTTPLSLLRNKVSTHLVNPEKERFQEGYSNFLRNQECK